jgi:hypothetical protein
MTDTFRLMEMSIALGRPLEPKIFCTARKFNRWGYVAHNCTMHAGHSDQTGNPNEHIDTHSGARWE